MSVCACDVCSYTPIVCLTAFNLIMCTFPHVCVCVSVCVSVCVCGMLMCVSENTCVTLCA